MTYRFDLVETAVGPLTVVVDEDGAVTDIWLSDVVEKLSAQSGYVRDASAIDVPRRQLEEYARGERRDFDLKLAPQGTDFQKKYWDWLMQVPFGETRTYGQLAAEMGKPNAARAIGRANATNPIGIVIPCHRVIGASGGLTGYGGGLPLKMRLLELEAACRKTSDS